LVVSAARAQTPFTCDSTVYLSNSLSTGGSYTNIDVLVFQGGSYTVQRRFTGTSLELGTFGYNMRDNFIYSIERGNDRNALYRIGSDFVPRRVGVITGFPDGFAT